VTGPGLATGDQPVDPRQIQPVERPKQRLGRDEPHRGRHATQIVGAFHKSPVLDAHAHPHVCRPGQRRRKRSQALVALGEDLERVVFGVTITSKIARRKPSGMSSWKRSLIEFTKIMRGRRHRNGRSSLAGHNR
jgi:hypothetical protein